MKGKGWSDSDSLEVVEEVSSEVEEVSEVEEKEERREVTQEGGKQSSSE